MRIRVKTPTPHGSTQKQIMEAFITPGLLECWVACGTKYGKTLSASGAIVAAAPLRQQALWRWIGPIYAQSKIGYNYLRRMLPPQMVELNKSDPSIAFPKLDSMIQFFHGQKPESIEGEATQGNVIDEAAKQKEAVYASVKTTTTQTRGRILCISTPLGKNWFYRGCMRAQEEMLRAKHEKRQPRAIFIHAPTYANPYVPAESIEELRRSLPARLFQQYVEAAFLDDGSVFMFLADAFGKPIDWWTDDVWYATTHESRAIYIGADWAKREDFSVFTAINDQGRLIGFKRFQRLTYPQQVAALWAFADEVKRNSVLINPHVEIEHDQTGVGEAVNDIINDTNPGYDVSGIVWNNTNKEAYVTDLMVSFEEKCLHLVPWGVLKSELEQFECEVLPSGKIRYAGPEGVHDDTVMSLVLANRLFRSGRGRSTTVAIVDQVNDVVRRIYYNNGVFED